MTSGQSSVIGPAGSGPPPGVNPKKQKRRQKMAAKAAAMAASAAANGHTHPSASTEARMTPTGRAPTTADDADADADEPPHHPHPTRQSQSLPSLPNGVHREHDEDPSGAQSKSKKNKKNKKKKKNAAGPGADGSSSHGGVQHYHSQHVGRPRSDDRFWNTNSNEERERIKAFWISLSEDERKNLVKLEKDTILKKMKEQQKNTCSCAVCGRKRSAIEQELEGLYDSYYRELENYANRADGSLIGGPGNFALQTPREPPAGYHPQVPPRSRLVEHVHEVEDEEEDSYGEEEYEDDEDAYSEDELSDDEVPRDDDKVLSDFLDFGNSLQVKGGILTVADDLLKNDGRKFIEMMEQLAERRMAREENVSPSHYPRMIGHRTNGAYAPEEHGHDDDGDHEHEHEHEHEHQHHHHHDHPHPHAHGHEHNHTHEHDHLHPDDDHEGDYEEDEEDEYDESQEGEYDEDEDEAEEAISDQQRMEEGRRMFQIFAARMFEQRVLSAYKKKLASERTEKLLQELAEEKRLEEEKKASKASKAAKKRDREKQKKLAAQEIKARKEAEKAAEEAAKRLEAEKRIEEQRRQVEEKRKAKEAQKKKEEEERNRKEAERLRRAQEQERKARQARESKEREKRLKEEQRLKDIQDAREAKERRDRELRERQKKEMEKQREQEQRQREQKEKDARARKEKQEAQERERRSKEAHAKTDRSAKDKQKALAKASCKVSPSQAAVPKGPAGKKQSQAQIQTTGAAQPPTQPAIISLPQHPAPPAAYASPKVSVATPIIPPRTLHPIRSRTSSQQQDSTGLGPSLSQQGSSTSHSSSPQANTPAHSSPRAIGPHVPGMVSNAPLTDSPSIPSLRGGLNTPPPHPFPLGRGLAMPPLPPPGFAQAPPGLQHRIPQDSIFPPAQPGYRYGPDIAQFPPGLTMPIGRAGYGGPPPPPGFPPPTADSAIMGHGFGFPSEVGMPPQPRQMSGSSIDPLSTPNMSAQTISRPAPIGRPASVVHGQRSAMDNSHLSTDDEQEHLGSRALLDDDADDPVPLGQSSLRQRTSAPGPNMRTQFPPTGFIDAAFGAPSPFLAQWGSPSSATFSPQSSLGANVWGAPTAGTQFSAPGVGPVGVGVGVGQLRTARPPFNAVALRHMLCKACQNLTDAHQADVKGYVEFAEVKAVIQHNLGYEVPEVELLAISETEGSAQNGGGSFDSMSGSGGRTLIRWVPGGGATEKAAAHHHPLGAPGDIGSPIIGSGVLGAGRGS